LFQGSFTAYFLLNLVYIFQYLENLVIPRSCDPELSLAENRIKALAEFFGSSCKAGPWVLDAHRDAELSELKS
jgi:hypothetical protein